MRRLVHRFFVLAGLGTAVLAAACSTTPGTPLPAVASRNDADGVRRMLAVGHPADERDGRGMTALMSAARFDAVDAMTVLLDAGAGANTRDTNHRWTALFHAIHTQLFGSATDGGR